VQNANCRKTRSLPRKFYDSVTLIETGRNAVPIRNVMFTYASVIGWLLF